MKKILISVCCLMSGNVFAAQDFAIGDAFYARAVVADEPLRTHFLKMAASHYRFAADQGHAEGQYLFGWCLENGTGVDQDSVAATYYYKLAADQGDADGQYNFGVCLENGTGVDQDPVAAAYYYKLSADQGYEEAQYSLQNLNARMQ